MKKISILAIDPAISKSDAWAMIDIETEKVLDYNIDLQQFNINYSIIETQILGVVIEDAYYHKNADFLKKLAKHIGYLKCNFEIEGYEVDDSITAKQWMSSIGIGNMPIRPYSAMKARNTKLLQLTKTMTGLDIINIDIASAIQLGLYAARKYKGKNNAKNN